jgi:hypothetical protein
MDLTIIGITIAILTLKTDLIQQEKQAMSRVDPPKWCSIQLKVNVSVCVLLFQN